MLRNFFTTLPPVVKNLLIINVLIWLAMALAPAVDRALSNSLALYYFSSPAFRPYQILSYMFLHGGFTHLLFNMFALAMFGRTIEMVMGSQRFLFYYITCGICAALVQLGVFAVYISNIESTIADPSLCRQIIDEGLGALRRGYNFTDPDWASLNAFVNTPMVGASGAIYGVLLAFGFLFPNMPVYIFFIPVPVKAKWLVIGYFILELFYGITGPTSGVAHFAHLGGMVFGLLLLIYWKRKGIFSNHWFF